MSRVFVTILIMFVSRINSYRCFRLFYGKNIKLSQYRLNDNNNIEYSTLINLNNNNNNTQNNNKPLNIYNPVRRYTLHEKLKEWRKRTSDELQKPLYTVISNNLIDLIALKKPQVINELSILPGIGPAKTYKYGASIINIVRQHVSYDDSLNGVEETLTAEDQILLDSAYEAALLAKKKIANRKKKASLKTQSTSKKTKKKSDIQVMTAEEIEMLTPTKIQITDLNDEQQRAAKGALNGNNMFITGSAGTGKSYLLKYVIQELVEKYGETAVAVTAPTGISAINIGGQTVHSFAGIGFGSGDHENILKKVLKAKTAAERWENCKVLIIDEISMLDKNLFELLDKIARSIRCNDLPMGGIQTIVVGDFMQLPPVQKGPVKEFCFQSILWEALGLHLRKGFIILEKVERQNDDVFIHHLNEVRMGIYSKEFSDLLDSCLVSKKPPPTDGIIPTKLYSNNKEVDEENNQRLAELPGEVVVVEADDKFKVLPTKESSQKTLFDGMENLIPMEIELKVGAQVMLLRNRSKMTYGGYSGITGGSTSSSASLVNGSRGKVIAFSESFKSKNMRIPTVQFDNGLVTTIGPVDYEYKNNDGCLVRSQIPLKLAWAATIHKSQGSTLTCAELMLSNIFDYGQAYVALSRIRDIKGLWLSQPILPSSVKANPDVLKFYGYI